MSKKLIEEATKEANQFNKKVFTHEELKLYYREKCPNDNEVLNVIKIFNTLVSMNCIPVLVYSFWGDKLVYDTFFIETSKKTNWHQFVEFVAGNYQGWDTADEISEEAPNIWRFWWD